MTQDKKITSAPKADVKEPKNDLSVVNKPSLNRMMAKVKKGFKASAMKARKIGNKAGKPFTIKRILAVLALLAIVSYLKRDFPDLFKEYPMIDWLTDACFKAYEIAIMAIRTIFQFVLDLFKGEALVNLKAHLASIWKLIEELVATIKF